MSENSFAALRRRALRRLAEGGVSADEVESEATSLVAFALGAERSEALFASDRSTESSSSASRRLDEALSRRLGGETVSRIIGRRGFMDFEATLSADVLDPRPETEVMVEWALEASPVDAVFVDLGTGSGCAAIAFARARSEARGAAIDRSSRALATAEANAFRLGAWSRLRFLRGDWSDAEGLARRVGDVLGGLCDAVLCNPPYVSLSEMSRLPREVADCDPREALYGGPTGVESLAAASRAARGLLRVGGRGFFEIASERPEASRAAIASAGFVDLETRRDLSGRERCVSGLVSGV